MKNKKVALITGATSGIGRDIAIALASQNIIVCVNYSKSQKQADELLNEIKSIGQEAILIPADITKDEEVKEMFSFIQKQFGRLDYLINNAGIYKPSLIEKHQFSDWQRIIDVNLNGKFLCTKYAIPMLKQSNNPRIINIASRCAIKADEESSAYCCSAAAIDMLTKVSALELAEYGIKVNTVSPGLTPTFLSQQYALQDEFEEYVKNNPSKRLGSPADVSNLVSFLISDQSNFINGENINVSGGILLK